MRDMEAKRAYDRERMAQALHADGKTWWQRQAGKRHRGYYDMARIELRNHQRRASRLEAYGAPLTDGEEKTRFYREMSLTWYRAGIYQEQGIVNPGCDASS